MTVERAFRVAHNLDIPEGKRKHWPQWAVIVVRDSDEIADVFQFFESPKEEDHVRCLKSYPRSMTFDIKAGEWATSMEEFQARVTDTVGLIRKLMKK